MRFKIPKGVSVEHGVMIAPRLTIRECECGCGNVHILFSDDDGVAFATAVIPFGNGVQQIDAWMESLKTVGTA